tara:strand:- start:2385 stop:3206 length:822 start_codon:yes stop_codon:yes gene_type:complete
MISGEQIQKLTQISLYTEINDIIKDQNKSLEQNLVNINDLNPNDIKQYNYIFVYSHFLKEFFDKFFTYLNDNVVIVSHNSDAGVDKTFLKYLKGDKISKWFCQNRLVEHEKLFSIPIGIANSQWPHGNINLLQQVLDMNLEKNNLVFKNYSIGTNFNERMLCNDITTHNNIPMTANTNQVEYFKRIARSAFVISPPGNGVDCHRIWECLYLKSVPIVKYQPGFSQFKHLPIMFVDNWEEVTIDVLRKKLKEIIFGNIPELTLKYWKEKICINE